MSKSDNSLISKFKKTFAASTLLRDTTSLSIGQGLRLIIQAAYFVLIARSLGPDLYGAFVSITALAALLSPFSGLGSHNLFIKNFRSGKRSSAVCWGNGLLLITVSGSLFVVAIAIIDYFFRLGAQFSVILAVCVSDLIFLRITELAAFGFAATGRMKDTSIQNVFLSLLRLAGIFLLSLMVGNVSLSQWTLTYLLASIIGTVYAIAKGSRYWGRPEFNLADLREDALEGVYFSVSTSATTIYNDIDKVMLSRLSDFAATGIYGAAYRIIDVSMTPVRSLASAAYPQFFQKGVNGIRSTYPYARSLISKTSLYGFATFAGLWVCAPAAPYILGSKYVAAIPALRWLSLIPLLRCVHVFLADALSGAGFQRARMSIQVLVALINIGLNLIILPRWSWRGAAWTSLACDAMLAGILWLTVIRCLRREKSQVEAARGAQKEFEVASNGAPVRIV